MAFNVTSISDKLVDTATDYLGIPVGSASPTYSARTSTDYFMLKVNSTQNGTFKCRLPDTVSLALSSKFSSLLEGKLGIVSGLNKIVQVGSSMVGNTISLNTKYTTAQIWEGSSPVSMTLPIELNATNDVDEEVLMPMLILSQMVLPREGSASGGAASLFNSLLRAPGPAPLDLKNDAIANSSVVKNFTSTLKDLWTNYFGSVPTLSTDEAGGDIITIDIGKFLRFTRCIITDVKWDINTTRLLVNCGKPMSVKGNFTFKSSYAMTTNDFSESLIAIDAITKLKHTMYAAESGFFETLDDSFSSAVGSISDKVTNVFGGK